MALVNLLVENHGESFFEGFYLVKVEAFNSKELLEKSRLIAKEYSTFYRFSWHPAKIYLYDPIKHKERPPLERDEKEALWTIEEIYEVGSYPEIVHQVLKTQGAFLFG
jgi:hypothetical protein